jgi:hypothetical protein
MITPYRDDDVLNQYSMLLNTYIYPCKSEISSETEENSKYLFIYDNIITFLGVHNVVNMTGNLTIYSYCSRYIVKSNIVVNIVELQIGLPHPK